MKRTLLTIVSALFAIASWSASYDVVCVDLNDGTTVDIALSSKLSLSFSDTHLLVKGTDADFEIPKKKILTFSHSVSSGIDDVTSDPSVALTGPVMHFKGLAEGSDISVYNLAGKCLRSVSAKGDYILALNDLPAAVYIVSVNQVAYKISLR